METQARPGGNINSYKDFSGELRWGGAHSDRCGEPFFPFEK